MSLQTSTLALPKPKGKRRTSDGDAPKARTWQVSYENDKADEKATGDKIVADKEARGIRSMNAYVKWAVETVAFKSDNVRAALDLEEAVEFLSQDFDSLKSQIEEAINDDDTDDDYKADLQEFAESVDDKRDKAIAQLSESLAIVSALVEKGVETQNTQA